MDITKIQLSAEEAELINNTEWILTKHRIIKKVYEMFGEINEMMKKELMLFDHLFGDISYLSGKITRGENYQLLPYIILDYPTDFIKNNILAIRTMFWWGNFFSITLHLSGDHKAKFINSNPALLLFLKENHFFICVNPEEWQHDFVEKNYLSATVFTCSAFAVVIKQPFFKVAKQLPVKQWDNAQSFIINSFKEILELLKINFPGDKKDL
ncbi:MAG: hypothetical protein ABIN97_06450 [Ginsengibacter sp.]